MKPPFRSIRSRRCTRTRRTRTFATVETRIFNQQKHGKSLTSARTQSRGRPTRTGTLHVHGSTLTGRLTLSHIILTRYQRPSPNRRYGEKQLKNPGARLLVVRESRDQDGTTSRIGGDTIGFYGRGNQARAGLRGNLDRLPPIRLRPSWMIRRRTAGCRTTTLFSPIVSSRPRASVHGGSPSRPRSLRDSPVDNTATSLSHERHARPGVSLASSTVFADAITCEDNEQAEGGVTQGETGHPADDLERFDNADGTLRQLRPDPVQPRLRLRGGDLRDGAFDQCILKDLLGQEA